MSAVLARRRGEFPSRAFLIYIDQDSVQRTDVAPESPSRLPGNLLQDFTGYHRP